MHLELELFKHQVEQEIDVQRRRKMELQRLERLADRAGRGQMRARASVAGWQDIGEGTREAPPQLVGNKERAERIREKLALQSAYASTGLLGIDSEEEAEGLGDEGDEGEGGVRAGMTRRRWRAPGGRGRCVCGGVCWRRCG